MNIYFIESSDDEGITWHKISYEAGYSGKYYSLDEVIRKAKGMFAPSDKVLLRIVTFTQSNILILERNEQ